MNNKDTRRVSLLCGFECAAAGFAYELMHKGRTGTGTS